MAGSSEGPKGGGIKGKDGMTRGGTKGGRVYVKTDRAGSDAKTETKPAPRNTGSQVGGPEGRPIPRSPNSVAKSGSTLPATKSEVARSGSVGPGNSPGSEVGRGPKDIGSGKSAGARGANLLEGPKVTTNASPSGVGVLARLAGLSRLAGPAAAAATVMTPSPTNEGEDEWMANFHAQHANDPVPSKKDAPAPVRKILPVEKKPAPAPVRKAAPAGGLSAEDKVAQLVQKGFNLTDASRLADAKGGKVDAPTGYAKGGFVKAPKAGKSLYSAAVPKVPDFGKDLGKAPKATKAPESKGMSRMPKLPATGKAAATNKMAAIMKPKKSK